MISMAAGISEPDDDCVFFESYRYATPQSIKAVTQIIYVSWGEKLLLGSAMGHTPHLHVVSRRRRLTNDHGHTCICELPNRASALIPKGRNDERQMRLTLMLVLTWPRLSGWSGSRYQRSQLLLQFTVPLTPSLPPTMPRRRQFEILLVPG